MIDLGHKIGDCKRNLNVSMSGVAFGNTIPCTGGWMIHTLTTALHAGRLPQSLSWRAAGGHNVRLHCRRRMGTASAGIPGAAKGKIRNCTWLTGALIKNQTTLKNGHDSCCWKWIPMKFIATVRQFVRNLFSSNVGRRLLLFGRSVVVCCLSFIFTFMNTSDPTLVVLWKI